VLGGTFAGALLGATALALHTITARLTKTVDLKAAGVQTPVGPSSPDPAQTRRLDQTYGNLKPHPHMRWMFVIWFGILALLFVYDAVLALLHSSRSADVWLQMSEPAVEWMGAYVPAIRQMPETLAAAGYADWAPVVQHAMFISWLVTISVLTWMMLDIWFLRRRMWTEATTPDTGDMTLAVIGSGAATLVTIASLLSGYLPLSGDSFVGSGLPAISFLFMVLAFLFYCFFLSSASLVHAISRRNSLRKESAEERTSRNKRLEALRHVFRKPRKRA
jgi:hypothetical protein